MNSSSTFLCVIMSYRAVSIIFSRSQSTELSDIFRVMNYCKRQLPLLMASSSDFTTSTCFHGCHQHLLPWCPDITSSLSLINSGILFILGMQCVVHLATSANMGSGRCTEMLYCVEFKWIVEPMLVYLNYGEMRRIYDCGPTNPLATLSTTYCNWDCSITSIHKECWCKAHGCFPVRNGTRRHQNRLSPATKVTNSDQNDNIFLAISGYVISTGSRLCPCHIL